MGEVLQREGTLKTGLRSRTDGTDGGIHEFVIAVTSDRSGPISWRDSCAVRGRRAPTSRLHGLGIRIRLGLAVIGRAHIPPAHPPRRLQNVSPTEGCVPVKASSCGRAARSLTASPP